MGVVTWPPGGVRVHSAGRSLEGDRRSARDLLDVVIRPGTVAGDDGPRQPAEHHGVVGGYEADCDRTADPCVSVDVVVGDGSADRLGDDVGDVADRQRLGRSSVRRSQPAKVSSVHSWSTVRGFTRRIGAMPPVHPYGSNVGVNSMMST